MSWRIHIALLAKISIILLFSTLLVSCYIAPVPVRVGPPRRAGMVVVPAQPYPSAVWVAPYALPNGELVSGYWR